MSVSRPLASKSIQRFVGFASFFSVSSSVVLLSCSGDSRFVHFCVFLYSKSSSRVQAAFEAYKETELPNLRAEVCIFFDPME